MVKTPIKNGLFNNQPASVVPGHRSHGNRLLCRSLLQCLIPCTADMGTGWTLIKIPLINTWDCSWMTVTEANYMLWNYYQLSRIFLHSSALFTQASKYKAIKPIFLQSRDYQHLLIYSYFLLLAVSSQNLSQNDQLGKE